MRSSRNYNCLEIDGFEICCQQADATIILDYRLQRIEVNRSLERNARLLDRQERNLRRRASHSGMSESFLSCTEAASEPKHCGWSR